MPTLAAWLPAVADVAALNPLRAGPTGTFSTTTTPSASAVAGIVEQVAAEVAHDVGGITAAMAVALVDGNPATTPAGRAVALGAAAHVELAYFPDLSGPRSPAAELLDWYRLAVQRLRDLAGIEGSAEGAAGVATWVYPDPVLTLGDLP